MEMTASSRALEITVISGEGLRVGRKRPVKKNVYVTVTTEYSCNVKTTAMDKEGGSYPAWNEKMVVDLPMHARYVTLRVQCKTFSGEKVIGEAKIPTSDFVGGFVPENYLHFLSYRLRDSKGEKNGIINFSVRVKNAPENTVAGFSSQYSRPWTGLPPAPDPAPVNATNSVVTGIPVWCSYQV